MDGQDINWATGRVNDLSGNNNTGVVSGMAISTAPAPGVVGQALKFDGVDDYVSVPDAASLDLPGALTLEFWLYAKTPQTNPYEQRIIAKGGDYGTYVINYVLTIRSSGSGLAGKVEFAYTNPDGTFHSVTSNTAISPNTWTHFAVTLDSSNAAAMYINGILDKTASLTASPLANDKILTIGAWWEGTYKQFFNGLIDEVRVYNRALTAAEIYEHYKSGRR
jgi:hypothetical protein